MNRRQFVSSAIGITAATAAGISLRLGCHSDTPKPNDWWGWWHDDPAGDLAKPQGMWLNDWINPDGRRSSFVIDGDKHISTIPLGGGQPVLMITTRFVINSRWLPKIYKGVEIFHAIVSKNTVGMLGSYWYKLEGNKLIMLNEYSTEVHGATTYTRVD